MSFKGDYFNFYVLWKQLPFGQVLIGFFLFAFFKIEYVLWH